MKVVAPILAAVAWLAAVAVVATYDLTGSGFHYTEPIDYGRVWALMPRVGVSEMTGVLDVYGVAFWVSVLLWYWGARPLIPSRVQRLALASPLVLLFPIHLMGALALAVDLSIATPYDGEFLGEHWPSAYVYALWAMFSAIWLVRAKLVPQRTNAVELGRP
jgi:hypothetical protein